MSRGVVLAAALSVAIVAILSAGSISAQVAGFLSSPGTPVHPTSAEPPTPTESAVEAPMLTRAVESINAASELAGVGASCKVTSGTAASCGGASPVQRADPLGASPQSVTAATTVGQAPAAASRAPSAPASTLAWYNVTKNISAASGGVVPTTGSGGRMAFDPALGEVVLFTGTSALSGVTNENVTWVYNGITWTNLTSRLPTAPSIRSYPGMDYDPAMHGVILVGGFSAVGMGLNDTWLFTGTWTNISATAGILRDGLNGGGQNGDPLGDGGIGASGAAWDPALGGFLLTDGCNDDDCTLLYAPDLAP